MRKSPVILLFFAGMAVGYFSFEQLNPKWQSSNEPQKLNVCFTPGGKCTDLIVKEIRKAKHSIKMQTYSFTSRPIAEALVEASKRGIKVEILIDRSLLKNPHSALPLLKANRIRFKVDRVPGIAHNKVIIIDNDSLIIPFIVNLHGLTPVVSRRPKGRVQAALAPNLLFLDSLYNV